MKTLKPKHLILGLLIPQTSKSFSVTLTHKKNINSDKSLKMHNDDDLFNDLFTKNNKSELTDEIIHKSINDYLTFKKEQNGLKLDAKQFLEKATKDAMAHYNNVKNLALFRRMKDDIQIESKPLSANDIIIATSHDSLIKDNKDKIYINENFLSKNIIAEKIIPNNPERQSTTLAKEVSQIFLNTDFDHAFLEKIQFAGYDYGKMDLQEGGVLRGQYQNKELYFLFSRTLDNALRIVDISQSKDKLGNL